MTRLAIKNKANGEYAIFQTLDIGRMTPTALLRRIDAAMNWLVSQPKPHEVLLDDPIGLAGALISAWAMSCEYPCAISLVNVVGKTVAQVGVDKEGIAFVNAFGV